MSPGIILPVSQSQVNYRTRDIKIYRGYYTVARRYEFYFRVAKQNNLQAAV